MSELFDTIYLVMSQIFAIIVASGHFIFRVAESTHWRSGQPVEVITTSSKRNW